MMTDGGWHSIAEVARLYKKSWKWVQQQVKRHNIGTEKRGKQRVLRLVDFIAQVGEPPSNGTSEEDMSHSQESEIITTESQIETALLNQENQFLRRRVEALEADKVDWKAERAKLQGIIERQTGLLGENLTAPALPAPDPKRGVLARWVQWLSPR